MIRRLYRRLKKSQHGAALLEFAIVLPVLLLLVMGILEFGWAFNGWITLTGAAREGARVAVVDANNANVTSAVTSHTTTFTTNPTVNVDRSDEENVTVTVTGSLPPLVGFFQNNDFVITVDATMRKEYLN